MPPFAKDCLRYMATIGRAVLVSLLAFGAQTAAVAQMADSQVAQQMTGGSSRKWIATPLAGFLGPGSRCSSGNTFTFFSNHTGRHDQCVGGTVKETNLTWRVLPQANEENVVEIGEQKYEIRFSEDAHTISARLRPIAPQGSTVSDLVLRYAKPEI